MLPPELPPASPFFHLSRPTNAGFILTDPSIVRIKLRILRRFTGLTLRVLEFSMPIEGGYATPAVSHDLATPAGLHHHRHQLHRNLNSQSDTPFPLHHIITSLLQKQKKKKKKQKKKKKKKKKQKKVEA
ncbi:hypothetical protein B296_00021549 [Ensete ventricosum]|uniref:Uncharacterized protein n=1 Tax=Ensete ventricosum TaxID=4639 RepID=A0A426YQM4_ENSVE|nr:hypothetical protein B296_00021549 [Ensete ventricosum]